MRKSDRSWIKAVLGVGADGAIDQKRHRIEVVEDGGDRAMALWLAKEHGPAFLGPVLVDAKTERRDLFHAAIIAVCRAVLAEGYTRGRTRVADARIVRILERSYDIKLAPVGRKVATDAVGHWEIEIDPAKMIAVAERKGLV